MAFVVTVAVRRQSACGYRNTDIEDPLALRVVTGVVVVDLEARATAVEPDGGVPGEFCKGVLPGFAEAVDGNGARMDCTQSAGNDLVFGWPGAGVRADDSDAGIITDFLDWPVIWAVPIDAHYRFVFGVDVLVGDPLVERAEGIGNPRRMAAVAHVGDMAVGKINLLHGLDLRVLASHLLSSAGSHLNGARGC